MAKDQKAAGDLLSPETQTSRDSQNNDPQALYKCHKCGEMKVEAMTLPVSGRVCAKAPFCDDCQKLVDLEVEAEEKRKVEAAKRRRLENIETLLKRVGVMGRYVHCSMENFQGKQPIGMPAYIYGPVGRGKTHLAVGFLREAILKTGEEAGRFIRAVDLFKEIRDTFSEKSARNERALLEEFGKAVPLLVIDDLGTEKVSEWVEQTLYDLIDRRYGELLDTIITSNLEPAALSAHYTNHGPRLMSRIFAMGPLYEVEGVDRRIKGRK